MLIVVLHKQCVTFSMHNARFYLCNKSKAICATSEAEIVTLLKHPSSSLDICVVRVVQYLAFCVVFCRLLFVLCFFFCWSLHCMLFFDLSLLITPLVCSSVSYAPPLPTQLADTGPVQTGCAYHSTEAK